MAGVAREVLSQQEGSDDIHRFKLEKVRKISRNPTRQKRDARVLWQQPAG